MKDIAGKTFFLYFSVFCFVTVQHNADDDLLMERRESLLPEQINQTDDLLCLLVDHFKVLEEVVDDVPVDLLGQDDLVDGVDDAVAGGHVAQGHAGSVEGHGAWGRDYDVT